MLWKALQQFLQPYAVVVVSKVEYRRTTDPADSGSGRLFLLCGGAIKAGQRAVKVGLRVFCGTGAERRWSKICARALVSGMFRGLKKLPAVERAACGAFYS